MLLIKLDSHRERNDVTHRGCFYWFLGLIPNLRSFREPCDVRSRNFNMKIKSSGLRHCKQKQMWASISADWLIKKLNFMYDKLYTSLFLRPLKPALIQE